jgi:hypothetical protein
MWSIRIFQTGLSTKLPTSPSSVFKTFTFFYVRVIKDTDNGEGRHIWPQLPPTSSQEVAKEGAVKHVRSNECLKVPVLEKGRKHPESHSSSVS